jgi:hypothetical protein
MDLTEIGCKAVDWDHLAQGYAPVAGSCEHGHEPSNSIKAENLLNSSATISF